MKRAYVSFAIVILVGLGGCVSKPYLRLRGAVLSTTAVKQPSFDASGLRLSVSAECHVQIVEQWCPLTNPQCRPNPTVVKRELATCPRDIEASNVSLRSPWGQVYPGAIAAGVLEVKIDWKTAGIDPLTNPDLATLRTGWVVHSDDGLVDAPLELTDDDVHSMLVAIGNVTGNDPSDAPASQHAALIAAFSNEPGTGGANRIVLSVTNRGPDPAYKVVAQLKSSSVTLHGIQLLFGRINRGETKTRTKDISTVNEADDPNPTVVAAVTSSNAPPASTSSKFRLAPKRARAVPLQLSCTSLDKEPAPGQWLRIQCESSNPGNETVRGVSYQIAIGKAAATSATGPAELAPHAHLKFGLAPMLPSATKLGSSLEINITMNAPNFPPVQQQLVVEIVEFHGLCKQGKLTRDAYRVKRKRLQAAQTAGALTQEEFDHYDAEMVSCIE
jgi:hypothetical protein